MILRQMFLQYAFECAEQPDDKYSFKAERCICKVLWSQSSDIRRNIKLLPVLIDISKSFSCRIELIAHTSKLLDENFA